MNIQSNFNNANQNNINNFFKASSFTPLSSKEPTFIINSSKIEHYVKMILLSLGIKEEKIQSHRNFYEDFDFDILMHINMIFLVEAYFDIFITDEEAEKIMTIQDLQKIIQSKIL